MNKKITILAVIFIVVIASVYFFREDAGDGVPEVGVPTAWDRAKEAVLNCEAEGIFQTHAREVSVKLKNGGTITAIEPKIDDIFDVVKEAAPQCGTIRMATE